jgi:hypothetical protein
LGGEPESRELKPEAFEVQEVGEFAGSGGY